MRKPLALLAAVAVIAAFAIWPMYWNFVVSIVPGWHTPILAPYAVAYIVVGAVLVGIVLAVLIRVAFGGARDEGRR